MYPRKPLHFVIIVQQKSPLMHIPSTHSNLKEARGDARHLHPTYNSLTLVPFTYLLNIRQFCGTLQHYSTHD